MKFTKMKERKRETGRLGNWKRHKESKKKELFNANDPQ